MSFSLCNSYLFAVVGTPAPSLLLLNCWVLGEDSDSNRIFPVEVDRNKNVGDLKEAIKEKMKPAFDHITANSLDVWNVSIPIDEDTNLQAQVKGIFAYPLQLTRLQVTTTWQGLANMSATSLM